MKQGHRRSPGLTGARGVGIRLSAGQGGRGIERAREIPEGGRQESDWMVLSCTDPELHGGRHRRQTVKGEEN